jgi:ABC-type amino acid transport substrate-binding protein
MKLFIILKHSMKQHYISVAAFFLALGLALSSAKAEILTVFGDDAYLPIIYSENGIPMGILPAILARAAKLSGDEYVIKLSPWKRAYELALRGEGGLVGVSVNQERVMHFDFSKSIYDDNIQIVTLKGKQFSFTKLEDLKGKTIGGVNGASYGEDVDQAIAKGLFIVERDVGQAGRLRKLLAGRLDAAFIGNGKAGFDAIVDSQAELRNYKAQFVVLPQPLTRDPLHLAFPKSMGKEPAIERFNAAIDQLRRSGELKNLLVNSSH